MFTDSLTPASISPEPSEMPLSPSPISTMALATASASSLMVPKIPCAPFVMAAAVSMERIVPRMLASMSFTCRPVSSERLRISSATTEKPAPAAPACAASMAAFIARRLVWLATFLMTLTTSMIEAAWDFISLTASAALSISARPLAVVSLSESIEARRAAVMAEMDSTEAVISVMACEDWATTAVWSATLSLTSLEAAKIPSFEPLMRRVFSERRSMSAFAAWRTPWSSLRLAWVRAEESLTATPMPRTSRLERMAASSLRTCSLSFSASFSASSRSWRLRFMIA